MHTLQTWQATATPCRSYACATPEEAAQVMNQEWSAHDIVPSVRRTGSASIHIRDLTPDVSVSTFSFGTGIRVQPRARADVLLMHMPLRGSARVRMEHGEALVQPGSWGVLHPPRIRHVDYSDDHEMLVLRLPMALLHTRLEDLLGAPLRKPLAFLPVVTQGDAGWASWAPLHAALGQLQQHRHAQPVLAALAEAAAAALLTGWPHSYTDELLQPRPPLAPRHVRRAEAFMREHAHQPLTSGRIAQHVGVSVRTLFDGFVAFRSMTPVQFLRRLRLDGTRADLQQGAGSVAEIALRWGFCHSGRFALGYRQRFGELPAQTLRATRGD